MRVRIATTDDLEGIAETLTSAFEADPLWGWAFPERAGLHAWWRFFAGSALRYPWTWIADDYASVAVWIPPGGIELTAEEEAAMGPLLTDLLGPRADEVTRLIEAFDENHPTERPHYYLSLLGTHASQRGKGLGMALLAENLATIDTERAPAYLESSNPANDVRYVRQGFNRIGGFDRPDGGAPVSAMWRDAR
ncbi:MAG: GNAT family N-acetyltransferase [Thermoleophilia bacterium]|nr:GNAT family N-acetyltransferase [Thermoleophilia bacterium]